MRNLLATGAAWLAGQFAAHCSQTVTYSRDGASVALGATIGRTQFSVTEADGLVREYESRDFIVSPADLDFGAGAGEVTPEPGDQIELVIGSRTRVFEVMSPGDEPVWRWADAYCQRRRIHTKLVSET